MPPKHHKHLKRTRPVGKRADNRKPVEPVSGEHAKEPGENFFEIQPLDRKEVCVFDCGVEENKDSIYYVGCDEDKASQPIAGRTQGVESPIPQSISVEHHESNANVRFEGTIQAESATAPGVSNVREKNPVDSHVRYEIPDADLQEVVSQIRSEEYAEDEDPPVKGDRAIFWGILLILLPLAFLFFSTIALIVLGALMPVNTGYTPVSGGADPPVLAASTTTSTSTSTTTPTRTTTSTTTTHTTTTQELIVCASPYIRYGLGCCLDRNSNGVCDLDEGFVPSTTTTLGFTWCTFDSDCGSTLVQHICRDNDVHRITVTYFCRNPGSMTSTCERKVLDDMVDHCVPTLEQCVKGKTRCQDGWAPSNFH